VFRLFFDKLKLAAFDGSVAKAAESMGVDRSHLYRRMKNLGINAEKGESEV
jgi:two-component system, NtrC family, nitrogen regulation response regulator NtrX